MRLSDLRPLQDWHLDPPDEEDCDGDCERCRRRGGLADDEDEDEDDEDV